MKLNVQHRLRKYKRRRQGKDKNQKSDSISRSGGKRISRREWLLIATDAENSKNLDNELWRFGNK